MNLFSTSEVYQRETLPVKGSYDPKGPPLLEKAYLTVFLLINIDILQYYIYICI